MYNFDEFSKTNLIIRYYQNKFRDSPRIKLPIKKQPRNGVVFLLILCSFCDFGNLAERLRVANCNVGQHLAIQNNVGFLQTSDQAAVGNSIEPGCCVNSGDPQLAQFALAYAAVAECIPQSGEHGFISAAIQLAASEDVTFRTLQ